MFYVYIIYSKSLDQYYIGHTNNLKRRYIEHNSGKSVYTSRANDWKLTYFEAFVSRKLAMNRERKLKPRGKAYKELFKRIIN